SSRRHRGRCGNAGRSRPAAGVRQQVIVSWLSLPGLERVSHQRDSVSDQGWVSETVTFDGGIVTDPAGHRMDPYSAAEGEYWTVLYQRAYLKHFFNLDPMDGAAL